ncbi:cytochrome c oxidase subunit II [Paenibacillus selenitireducens]|uniref:Cytochrome c oxidase subunit 2 n=1 Tax=Paenibacillus selenitireducens TaxID=1324314 RepID=A0A1T2X708_9BACL|nr:cytochrome c oxidase subunit II [Paenibacillus selenitireducens]OPA75622.1 cytochrome c oxidase subunit II [Paenibacillus selenitireducens]
MMNRWHAVKRLLPILAGLALLLSACGRADLSTLQPQGPIAEKQYDLMKLSIGMMTVVVVIVFVILGYVLVRFRKRPGQTDIPKQVEGSHKLEIIWTVIPIILLVILVIPTVKYVFEFAEDYSKDKNAVQVKVTSHQYWWEFEYPQYGVKTGQELVIPTSKKISLQLNTADVLHSFWVPSLFGKIDTNPEGTTNKAYFEAPKAGVYFGKCAELCGPSHALMDFKVKAVDDAKFDEWVKEMKAPAVLPEDPALAATFEQKCLSCHAVGDKGGTLGPNLTGIGNKQAIASVLLGTDGTVEENLKTWISDPVKVKPGSKMPKVPLTAEELDGISKYLANYKLNYDNSGN